MTLPAKPATQDTSLAVHQSGFRQAVRQRPLLPQEQLLTALIDRLQYVGCLTPDIMSRHLTTDVLVRAIATQPSLVRILLEHCSPIPVDHLRDEMRDELHRSLLKLALIDPESDFKLSDVYQEIPCDVWVREIEHWRLWSMILATSWWEKSHQITASVCNAALKQILEYPLVEREQLFQLLGGEPELLRRFSQRGTKHGSHHVPTPSLIRELYEPDEIHFKLLVPLAVQFLWNETCYTPDEIPTNPALRRPTENEPLGYVTDPPIQKDE